MIQQSLKYYCDKTLRESDDEKWLLILHKAIYRADRVVFNILSKKYSVVPEINAISIDLEEKTNNLKKIYTNGYSLIYNLSEDVIKFILSKRYSDWLNYYLEDISFLDNGTEFFATITHENYIIILMTESEKENLNSTGFNFIEWNLRR